MAYNAVRSLATMTIRASNDRVKAQGGAHHNTFLALEAAMGTAVANLAAYFDICREKRNELSYETGTVVMDTEAEELLRNAMAFRDQVEAWIADHHPEYAKRA